MRLCGNLGLILKRYLNLDVLTYSVSYGLGKGKRGAHGKKKILVARVFSLQRQDIYQIKAKRSSYLIKDFISSNFKKRLSFLLSNFKVWNLLLKLQPFRVVKYSLPFYCI